MFLLVIFLLCPPLALVPLVMGGVIIGLQYAFQGALHQGMLGNQNAIHDKHNALVESLNGRETIRQLTCYGPFQDAWKNVTDAAATSQANLSIWQGMVHHLCNAAIILNSVLLIAVGVYQINAGNLSVGGLLAVNLLSARALAPLTQIGHILAKWPHLATEMKAIEQVLAEPVERSHDEVPFTVQGNIGLQRATVQYPGQPNPVLRDITLTIPQGKKLALVGPTGAGKTTLLKVLSAEMPLHSGSIRWDERDAQHLAPAALRAQLGIVDQYPYFFARSLRENLTLGVTRDDAEIRHALEIVGMDAFVKAAGRGLDLPIAEGGANLSGGQRQCIAIARALLRQAPVLLMDEPTSMMDHVMESRLVHNLNFVAKDKTLVVVTHRTPLLSLVDSIAVLDGGRITKHGSRNEVLKELSDAAKQ
jgi:ATP-binding cassette subfamily C protein LapB